MAKTKPQIKTFQPPAQGAHWFECTFGKIGDWCLPFAAVPTGQKQAGFLSAYPDSMIFLYHIAIFALSARDAHYQLSIQMEALGWSEGQNWRVTMICPEAEK